MYTIKKIKTFWIFLCICLAGCSRSAEKTVMCIQVDPLEKVFIEQLHFVETPDTAAVAKGETATFQFVIRSAYPIQGLQVDAGILKNGKRQIAATEKAFVGYIHNEEYAVPRPKVGSYPASKLYPDCLQDVESIDVDSMQNQPVWIGYAIPHDAADGNYTATLVFTGTVNGKGFKITKQVNAKVYPVTVPEQTLWVTNWFVWDNFSFMNENRPVEKFSERWWELFTEMVHIMRDHGQNTYWMRDWTSLFNLEYTGTQLSWDFTNFDRIVEFLIREGNLKRIEGGILGARMGEWGTDFGIYTPKGGTRPLDDEMAQNYLSQFLPALYSHLKSKGWAEMYVQHVFDEPSVEDGNNKNIPLYIRVAELVKKHLPGIPIIEALSTTDLVNTVDILVPRLDYFHKDYAFYRERQEAGDEVWFYNCCCSSNGHDYANRFLEKPLAETRYTHWINYLYGATGYLHWGFNWWRENPSAFSNSQAPGGDAWIVYPTCGKLYASMRLKAMRDGINDYELLKLLEQKAPDKAKELAGAVIKGFDSYELDIRAFRLTRLALLKALGE